VTNVGISRSHAVDLTDTVWLQDHPAAGRARLETMGHGVTPAVSSRFATSAPPLRLHKHPDQPAPVAAPAASPKPSVSCTGLLESLSRSRGFDRVTPRLFGSKLGQGAVERPPTLSHAGIKRKDSSQLIRFGHNAVGAPSKVLLKNATEPVQVEYYLSVLGNCTKTNHKQPV